STTSTTSTSSTSSVSSSGATMCQAQGTTCTDPAQCCKGMCVKSMKSATQACDCQPDYTCAESISMGGDPSLLCDGSSSPTLYDMHYNCQCKGKCMMACAASSCAANPMPADPQCDACLQDTLNGCGNEEQACANDF